MEGLQSNKLNLLNLDRFGFVVTNSSEFQLLNVARRHASVSVYCFCNKLYKCKKLFIIIETLMAGKPKGGHRAYKEWAFSVK